MDKVWYNVDSKRVMKDYPLRLYNINVYVTRLALSPFIFYTEILCNFLSIGALKQV